LTANSPADSQALPTGQRPRLPEESVAHRIGDDSPVSANHFELIDPDVRLMLLVKEGNAAAFEQLVRQYQDRVLAILRNLISNQQLAEDLAQDVFLRMYRARESYVPNAKFSTWVFTITQNVAKNAVRQLSRRREQQVSGLQPTDGGRGVTMEQLATDASGLQPARQLDRLEMSEIVRLALATLSERQRMAVLLAKFENMSYQEIGDTMGLTVPAIKSLLSRARNNLRDALQPYLEKGGLPRPGVGSTNPDP
jgi:RNA polymerase sigma-70 factor, ECF subfamily